MPRFSERHGYELPDAEITVRHDAPPWLRDLIKDFAYEAGFKPSDLRATLCRVLMESPSPGNWSEYPNIDFEVSELLERAPWFFVYDLIEELHDKLAKPATSRWEPNRSGPDVFAEKINVAFRKKGVGWQLSDGQIQVRGPEVFERAVRTGGRTRGQDESRSRPPRIA